MTLTFELDLHSFKMNQRTKCPGQRSSSSNVVDCPNTHTQDRLLHQDH